MSLSSLAIFANKNCSWFVLSLLFERVVFLWWDDNSYRDDSGSDKSNSSIENKVESGIEKRYVYGEDKKLWWKYDIFMYLQFLM